ncbi:type I-B CRISPR-associated protein Cas8b1/Cst1 [Fusibacter sp. Q10-2]|uniref:Type I-B CRISPR-associated protein Cas8b1/Cst1 n=2 Tax=Fusibacter ferrireducens TaxID=2785058 RepID=A0ABR9ZU39_9FIRM|nr:type I-B CRISPR-associated protein Cas8b1/Cst1 [Fusibacter ferrireducens]
MNDWLFNAGLVGLVNILKKAGDEALLDVKDYYVEFDTQLLEQFEEKYFNYFIETYKETLPWFKIVSYEKEIIHHIGTDYEHFDENALKTLNEYVQKTLKNNLKKDSFVAAYPLVDDERDVIAMGNQIEMISLKKGEQISDVLTQIKETHEKIQPIIAYCNRDDAKKYLAAKNVIYTIIKIAWNGVCFLNPQTKIKDMYVDYRQYFLEPAQVYFDASKKKYKYNCFNCGDLINDNSNVMSFLNAIGFDVGKKTSHVWAFNNDIALCPLCKLIYSCVPAGMTYVYNRGVYINENQRLSRAIRINENLKNHILESHVMNTTTTYKGMITAFNEQFQINLKYELADVQLIQSELIKKGKNEKILYKFSLFAKHMIEVFYNSRDILKILEKAGYEIGPKKAKIYFSVYEQVIERIFNNQNLFTLIHKLILYKLTDPQNCYYQTYHITSILEMNTEILKGVGAVENIEKEVIKRANSSGYYLREAYKSKGAKDKLNGISYRLLNALKTNNINMFMDTVLNCYLYTQKSVASIFLETFEDEEHFKSIGYAFVTGLIEGKENDKPNGGNN